MRPYAVQQARAAGMGSANGGYPQQGGYPAAAAGGGAGGVRSPVPVLPVSGPPGHQQLPPRPIPPQGYVPQAAQPPPPPAPGATPVPPGTLPPGTVVHVGDCIVTVERFLSEGGFAHVYLATSTVPLPKGAPNATTRHVLKRMVVPDKRGVAEVGKEVDVMRQLKNHPKIVNMIEASVADLPGGVDGSKGYEIYILMEWCQGGGIIDMMNTRLQNRLTEGEILKIFSDVVEAVAHMHYQNPPLIHRDLKVENILLSPPQTYKLCDFGSTTKPLPRDKVPTTVEGIQKIELEINKTTTLQYRAPELVDVWGRKGFDEKIDIWALGVFLYKLCFYTTPFEEHGPLAILNAQYKFPPYPAYSAQIRGLIASMLQERASQRPNIYQVHEAVCKLRGVQVRLENKYAASSNAQVAGSRIPANGASLGSPASSMAAPPSLPSSPAPGGKSPLANIITNAPSPTPSPGPGMQSMYGAVPGLSGNANQVAPMRRGRPTKATASDDMQLLPERQVRTGNAALGGGGGGFGAGAENGGKLGGTTGSWDAFAGLENLDGGTSKAGAGSIGSGFADAFAPTSPVHTTAPRFPAAPSASGDLETSVQMPNNAAMFAALSKTTSGAEAEDDDERKRFETTFPDIDADPDFLQSPTEPSPTAPPLIPSLQRAQSTTALPESPVDARSLAAPVSGGGASKMPSQLTGEAQKEEAGPPLPRRPPSASSTSASLKSPTERPAPNPKPNLVSRGSQTSPRLMASWKPPTVGHGSSSSPDLTESAPTSSSSARPSSLRQSSIPDLELFPSTHPESRGEAAVEDRKAVVDLLGDDDDAAGSSALGGLGADAFMPLQANASAGPPQDLGDRRTDIGNVADKRASFLADAQTQQRRAPAFETAQARSPSGSPSFGSDREKFRPQKRTSLGGVGVAPPPVKSPKPASATSPMSTQGPPADDLDAASIQARFPDLDLEDKPSPVPPVDVKAIDRDREQWDDVVEKEDAADSSDEETSAASRSGTSGAKLAPPAFDEDDLPAARVEKNTAARPRFGAGGQKAVTASHENGTSVTGRDGRAPTAKSQERQSSYASTSSEGGGGAIDLGPALASIHRFAPQSNPSAGSSTFRASPVPTSPDALRSHASPPLSPAAKSRSGSINSLVSRYEGRGLTGGPPPPGKKPVGLRKNSGGSISSNHSEVSEALQRRDPVQPQRLPQWVANGTGRSPAPVTTQPSRPSYDERDEEDSAKLGEEAVRDSSSPAFSQTQPPRTATPTMTDRQPFKPTPPPGSPSAQRAAGIHGHSSRPSFGGNGGYPRSQAGPAAVTSGGTDGSAPASGEQEERFAGVSNMKSRWESMAKAKDADIKAARTGPRKEHAEI